MLNTNKFTRRIFLNTIGSSPQLRMMTSTISSSHHHDCCEHTDDCPQQQQQQQHSEKHNRIPFFNPNYYNVIHELQHNLPEYPYDKIKTNTIAPLEYFNQRIETLPKDQKQDYTVQKSVATRFAHEFDTYCHYCWATVAYCHCDQMTPVVLPTEQNQTTTTTTIATTTTTNNIDNDNNNNNHNNNNNIMLYNQVEIVFLMTYKEFHRASNSAKVVLNSLKDSRLLIRGLNAHEKQLDDILNNNGKTHNVYIMFPSTDSLSIHETDLLKQQCQSSVDNRMSEHDDQQAKKHVVLVIDGTWREARRMNKNIPSHIPRIRLQPLSNPLFDGLRKQLFPGSRTSTCEAVVLLLRELGMKNEHCDIILNNLKVMINHVRRMSNKELISFDE